MTRINRIPVEELHQKHLVAEYRELPRVFALCDKHYSARKPMAIPFNYTMGKGHVLFFYNKLKWLSDRYSQLINEMKRRGYNPSFANDFPNKFNHLPNTYWGNWCPTDIDRKINRDRINLRLSEMAARLDG